MKESPFRFGLERVRQVRAHAEERAKEQFAASLNVRASNEAMLRAAERRLRETLCADREGEVSGQALVSMQAYVERLERTRAEAERQLELADAELARQRANLAEASRGREVLDRLEDRQRADHRLESDRRAGVVLDEIALQQHARRAAA